MEPIVKERTEDWPENLGNPSMYALHLLTFPIDHPYYDNPGRRMSSFNSHKAKLFYLKKRTQQHQNYLIEKGITQEEFKEIIKKNRNEMRSYLGIRVMTVNKCRPLPL